MNQETKPRHNVSRADTSSCDPLDLLLAAHFAPGEELPPSSGFASSVMDALQAEADAPAPIQFPWRRVVPGIIAIVCAMAVFAVLAVRVWKTDSSLPARKLTTSFPATLPVIHLSSMEQALVYTALAAVLSVAVAMGSMRLAGSGRR
jgi:hypothetical protein